jgi:hypothetical protein
MGGGKSSGNSTTTVQQTPEQAAALKAQTDFLTKTAFPAYTNTISGAGNTYNSVAPAVTGAANNAMNVAGTTGAVNEGLGISNSLTGSAGLSSLFDPQYENQQVDAALQAGRESARESQAGQNAMYGGAGGLGSSRMALADANLSSLNAQRQATAAASARAGVQANKAQAAGALLSAGGSQLGAANTAAGSRINYAASPQDAYSKYASVVFGVPQGNTTPNFAGTQGSTQSGGSKGFKI